MVSTDIITFQKYICFPFIKYRKLIFTNLYILIHTMKNTICLPIRSHYTINHICKQKFSKEEFKRWHKLVLTHIVSYYLSVTQKIYWITKCRKYRIHNNLCQMFVDVDYLPVNKVPMTLTAKRATLSDFGNAYWIHKWESNWIANICNTKSRYYMFLKNIFRY